VHDVKNDREQNERKPYESPSVARVVIDPIKEMLTVCEAEPGKLPAGPNLCGAVGS
jgi:hypothetical protein